MKEKEGILSKCMAKTALGFMYYSVQEDPSQLFLTKQQENEMSSG